MNEEQIRQTIQRVISIMEDAGVPPELRATVFNHVWTELTGTATPARTPPSAERAPQVTSEGAEPFAAFAQRLGVEPQALVDIYQLQEDGSFSVDVPPNVLPDNKREATIQLALLVCAGRQVSLEGTTSGADISRVCDDHDRPDRGNFATHMRGRSDVWRITGRGRGRPSDYELRRTGWQQAGEVVQLLAGS